MNIDEIEITTFLEPVQEDKSKYYDKAKLNEFAVSVEEHKKMFDELLNQKLQKTTPITTEINKTTPDSAVNNPIHLFSPNQKRKNLLVKYQKIRKEPITMYDKNFFQKFEKFDDEVKRFLESHNIKSLGVEDFSKQLANFFENKFLNDYDESTINEIGLSIVYLNSKEDYYKERSVGVFNNKRGSPFSYLIQRLNTQRKKNDGGKRRRSTKRKSKRSKRKQKRNTKRRASHRRRR